MNWKCPSGKSTGHYYLTGINFQKSFQRYICKKTNQKFNAPIRIRNSTSPSQRKTLTNSFNKSQFSYFPLIWMFSFKEFNYKIDRIYEKSSQIIWNDHQPTLDEILDTLNEETTHQQCMTVCWLKSIHF